MNEDCKSSINWSRGSGEAEEMAGYGMGGKVLQLGRERGGDEDSREEGEGCTRADGRTDERLGNQPADGAREPHQRRELLRQS